MGDYEVASAHSGAGTLPETAADIQYVDAHASLRGQVMLEQGDTGV
jgi:hypothetical protein